MMYVDVIFKEILIYQKFPNILSPRAGWNQITWYFARLASLSW